MVPEAWKAPINLEMCLDATNIITQALEKLPMAEKMACLAKSYKDYQTKYYHSIALGAFVYSMARRTFEGPNAQKVVEDLPANESLTELFNDHGFSLPSKKFKPFNVMLKTKAPDHTGIMNQMKQYPHTIQYGAFLRNYTDLLSLVNSLGQQTS